MESRPEYLKARERLKVDAANAARAYGIRWLVFHRSSSKAELDKGKYLSETFTKFQDVSDPLRNAMNPRPAFTNQDLEIFELPGARPLAFLQGHGDRGLSIRLGGDGVDVDVPKGEACSLIVNFLAWPHMNAYAGGKSVKLDADDYGRIKVEVPAGASAVSVRYEPPWASGLLAGARRWLGLYC